METTMRDLDERLKRYYSERSLNPATLESLVSLCDVAVDDQHKPATTGRFQASYLLYVGAAAACLVFLFVSVGLHERGSLIERTDRTIQEAAMNHTTRLELEHHDSSLPALNLRMVQLPFSLTVPERLDTRLELVGARYCTLAGHLAAHVKFKHRESGEAVSLFVTTLHEDLQAIPQERSQIAGVDVEMWQESGLFFAMASQI
jgi:hypothetical protein